MDVDRGAPSKDSESSQDRDGSSRDPLDVNGGPYSANSDGSQVFYEVPIVTDEVIRIRRDPKSNGFVREENKDEDDDSSSGSESGEAKNNKEGRHILCLSCGIQFPALDGQGRRKWYVCKACLMVTKEVGCFRCGSCDYTAPSFPRLAKHYRETHVGGPQHACPHCKKNYAYASLLKGHLLTHTGERPYTCEYCSYSTKHKHSLILHTRTHTGEKPFACTMCPHRSNDKKSITLHMRTHTGEKPYACAKCEKVFALAGQLKRHLRTHGDVDPSDEAVASIDLQKLIAENLMQQ